MRPISKAQIAKIWTSAKELSLSREELYEIIFACSSGKESLRSLDITEGKMVIDRLISLGASKEKRKIYKKQTYKGNVIEMMTPAQRDKVLAVMYSIGWEEEEIDAFAKRLLSRKMKSGMGITFRNWRFIPKKYASDLIEGLKGVKKTRSQNT